MAARSDENVVETTENLEELVAPDLDSVLTTSILKLEEIENDLYRGHHLWKPSNGRAVFGGQVVGQSLVAAGKTVPPEVHVHSLHCYFVRPGNNTRPILYQVSRMRDGLSFCTREVTAIQNGEVIHSMLVSYHRAEPTQLEHQFTMPEVTQPDQLATIEDILRIIVKEHSSLLPDHAKTRIQRFLSQDVPIEVKPVDVEQHYLQYLGKAPVGPPRVLVWIRAKGHIGVKNNNIHRCVAAYISDWALLSTALRPFPDIRVEMMASLDHSMWFHAPFRADEWMLYESENPRTIGGRALVFGRLWTRDGILAVSVAQEGIIRGTLKRNKDSKTKSNL